MKEEEIELRILEDALKAEKRPDHEMYINDDISVGTLFFHLKMMDEAGFIRFSYAKADQSKDPVAIYLLGITLPGKQELERRKQSFIQRFVQHAKKNDVEWTYNTLWFVLGAIVTILLNWIFSVGGTN